MVFLQECPADKKRCAGAPEIFRSLHAAREDGRYEEVVSSAAAIQQMCPDCPHAAMDAAWASKSLGDFAAAEEVANRLFEEAPRYRVEASVLKGSISDSAKGPKAALSILRKAHKLDPEAHEPNCQLAGVYLKLERLDDALPFARRAYATRPGEARAVRVFAAVLAEMGLDKELHTVAARVDPKTSSTRTRVGLAEAFLRADLVREAKKWCRPALRSDPDHLGALCLMARLNLSTETFPTAARQLKKLARLDPEGHSSFVALQLARISMETKNDVSHALSIVIEARIKDPDNVEVKETLDLMTQGIMGEMTKMAGEGEELKQRFKALNSEHESLRKAMLEMHAASEPGTPLLVALVDGEGQTLEFMKKFPDNIHDLAKEIAAFSTSNDGTIFLGVGNDGEILGLPDLDDRLGKDKLMNRIGGIASGSVTPSAKISVSFIPHEGKTVVRVFVFRGSEPVYYASRIPYLRDLDRSRPAEPHEVAEIVRERTATRR